MKKYLVTLAIAASSLLAIDYSLMTTEELQAMRGTVPVEERAAFQAEMQKRIQTMSAEERAAMAKGQGQGNGQMLRDGSGAGSMSMGSNRGGSGGGNGGGNGGGGGGGGNGKGRN